MNFTLTCMLSLVFARYLYAVNTLCRRQYHCLKLLVYEFPSFIDVRRCLFRQIKTKEDKTRYRISRHRERKKEKKNTTRIDISTIPLKSRHPRNSIFLTPSRGTNLISQRIAMPRLNVNAREICTRIDVADVGQHATCHLIIVPILIHRISRSSSFPE